MYEIRRAIQCANIPTPETIVVDGRIHRFPTNGKRGDKAGYYCFWDDGNGFISGYFGDWRTGVYQTWHSKKADDLRPEERGEFQRCVKEARERAEKERRRMAERAKKKARSLWEKAGPAKEDHAYLANKHIKPYAIKQLGNSLLVPVCDVRSNLHGLQFIYPDGSKRFLTGTPVKGHFFKLGDREPLYICEGYATGASIYEAFEEQGTVIVAFNAGNLKHVAMVIRQAHPEAKITICADDDRWTEGNPGLTKATEAARAVGGLLAVPEFQDTSTKPTDFNNLALLQGIDEVKRQIYQAKEPGLDIEAELERLARLSLIQYEREREEAAKRLDVRVSILDEEVRKRRPKDNQQKDRTVIIEELEPWDEPVNGAEVLRQVKGIIQAHVILKPEQTTTCAVWVALTYCYDAFRILPMLSLTSPEKRCGKTTLLEVLNGLVKAPILASNITPAALYRVVEGYQPCLLVDEADTFINGNDELRGIINSGHTRQTAYVIRVNGETLEPERFSTWGPKVISLIGTLPDTNRDRSIEIRLERKLASEKVKRLPLDFAAKMEPLRRQLLRWANDNLEKLQKGNSEMPEVGNDRAMDNWTPLFAIAEVAGGEWPEALREAMLSIEQVCDTATIRQELLSDIKQVLNGRDRISSKELVEALIELEDRPWAEWKHGKPLTQNTLARLLKPFGITSTKIRLGEETKRGYLVEHFQEAFKRYLPQDPPTQSGTMEQSNDINKLGQKQSGTERNSVPLQNEANILTSLKCSTVPLQDQGDGGEQGVPHGHKQDESLLWEGEL